MSQAREAELAAYVDQAKSDAAHAFKFLKDSGTLSASLTFHVFHKVPDHDTLLTIRFPQPWQREQDAPVVVSTFSDKRIKC